MPVPNQPTRGAEMYIIAAFLYVSLISNQGIFTRHGDILNVRSGNTQKRQRTGVCSDCFHTPCSAMQVCLFRHFHCTCTPFPFSGKPKLEKRKQSASSLFGDDDADEGGESDDTGGLFGSAAGAAKAKAKPAPDNDDDDSDDDDIFGLRKAKPPLDPLTGDGDGDGDGDEEDGDEDGLFGPTAPSPPAPDDDSLDEDDPFGTGNSSSELFSGLVGAGGFGVEGHADPTQTTVPPLDSDVASGAAPAVGASALPSGGSDGPDTAAPSSASALALPGAPATGLFDTPADDAASSILEQAGCAARMDLGGGSSAEIDASWLNARVEREFKGADVSVQQMTVAIFELLASSKSDEALQNDLFELVGSEKFELMSDLLQHRQALVMAANPESSAAVSPEAEAGSGASAAVGHGSDAGNREPKPNPVDESEAPVPVSEQPTDAGRDATKVATSVLEALLSDDSDHFKRFIIAFYSEQNPAKLTVTTDDNEWWVDYIIRRRATSALERQAMITQLKGTYEDKSPGCFRRAAMQAIPNSDIPDEAFIADGKTDS